MKLKATALTLVFALTMVSTACTVDQVLSDINLLLQTATSISTVVGALSQPDALALQAVINTATAGLNVIQTDYDAYEKSGATTDLEKLQAAITTLRDNLPAELAAVHVTNPNAIAKATAWVNLVTTTLQTILSVLPRLSKGKMTAEMAAAVPTPAALQSRWDLEVCNGENACKKLVRAKNIRR